MTRTRRGEVACATAARHHRAVPPASPAPDPSAPDVPEGDAADDGAVPGRSRRWRRPRGRVVAGWVALVAALGLVAAVFGVTSARTTASLGPHVATYAVTTDGEVSVDLGPLGALVLDAPLPLHLGVDVAVAEIPADLTEVGASTSVVELLGGDLQGYLQLFTAPQATLDVVTQGLVADAVQRWLLTWGGLVAVTLVGRALLGRGRRAELLALGRRHRVWLAVVLVVALVGAVVAAGLRPQAQRDAAGSGAFPVLDGTPLEGARVTGRLAGVVDLVAGFVTEQVEENDAFYAAVTTDLERAWAAASPDDPAVAAALAARGVEEPTASPTTATAPTATGSSDGDEDDLVEDAELPAREVEDPLDDEVVTALVISDLHCNVGMAGPVARVAALGGADLVLNAGDTTMNGSSVEQTCVTAFASALGDLPVVVADGNHDSADTAAQERAAGWTVLEGDVVEVEGLRLLGAPDPRATRLLAGTEATAEAPTAGGLADELATRACDDGDVDLLLIHDASIAAPSLEQGCVPASVSGHYHVRTDPEQVGRGIRYISSSTAGAVLNQLTVGPLNGTAEATLLRFDREDGRLLSWRLVTASPQAEVTVSPWQAWPEPEAQATDVAAAPPSLLPPATEDGEPVDPDDVAGAPGQPALDEEGQPLDDGTGEPGADGAGATAPPATPGG